VDGKFAKPHPGGRTVRRREWQISNFSRETPSSKAMGALAALLLAALLAALAYLLRSLVWVPHRLERRLRRQGIRGPPRSLLYGNAAEYRALIAAHSAPLASFHHAFVGRAAPEWWPSTAPCSTAARSCSGSGHGRGWWSPARRSRRPC
uniref:Cytochrome P450 n=2 Tax=Aegilops tauschii subsp. strangulata TaxID=200361 RepID=A0A452Z314_AEGTS